MAASRAMASPAASTAVADQPAKATPTEGRGAGMAEGAEDHRARVPATEAPPDIALAKGALPAKVPPRAVLPARVLAGVGGIPDRRGPGAGALRAMTSSTRAIPR